MWSNRHSVALLLPVFFDEAAGLWKEKQSLTTADGLKTSQELVYEPMGDGLLRVSTNRGVD